MVSEIQSKAELEAFYAKPDPWDYHTTKDDQQRKDRLMSVLPDRAYKRVLDIGCGNGFVTSQLPGEVVRGCDVSENAIHFAKDAAKKNNQDIDYFVGSIFDLNPETHGTYDLILITGVLYPQYIGKAGALVRLVIDGLLEEGGVLVTCHIEDWFKTGFPYATLDRSFYPYREYFHRLEVYQK